MKLAISSYVKHQVLFSVLVFILFIFFLLEQLSIFTVIKNLDYFSKILLISFVIHLYFTYSFLKLFLILFTLG